MMRDPVKERTKGKWPSILMQLGFPQKALSHLNGPCPMCGGKDRFRFLDTDGYGTWYCNQCGGPHGNGGGSWGIFLIMAWKHVNFRGAVDLVEGVVGKAALTKPQKERGGEDQAREAMKWLWESAVPLDGMDPASHYLSGRGIVAMPAPTCVRYAASMPDYVPALKRKVYRPAMLAKVANSERASLHITFLTLDGEKAEIEKVKRFFTGVRVPHGGAVRLGPAEEVMGVATGIETSLSAAQKHGFPVWAALSDVGLTKFQPPPQCRKIVIFGDRDENYSGQLATITLAHELVRNPNLKVRFRLPPGNFKDWNDVVRAERDATNITRIDREQDGIGKGNRAAIDRGQQADQG